MVQYGNIAIINYGIGNLGSLANICKFFNINFIVTSDPKEVLLSDILILPGVGSFNLAMKQLNTLGLSDSLREAVLVKKKKILGICLGFQMFAEESEEDGMTEGLGFLPKRVVGFRDTNPLSLKVPHVGFNDVTPPENSRLFKAINPKASFYFVHSYYMPYEGENSVSITDYGEKFISAYEAENVFGTQFHPEKSQTNGLQLFENFLKI